MIPVSLRIHNFMPYKGDAPELCFTSIHTACISGDNGAGKSSIIDAITWALWGKSRAKSDDDLIHQGENEAGVEFDFSSGGELYRVIRKHARPKGKRASGQSSLDLFICNEWKYLPLTAERISQTQDKIESVLHMDYETFTNSAYLRQGHADEFTRQPPARRKEVLASILGLSIYDAYEERAKERAKAAEVIKLQLSAAIVELEADLSQRSACETERDEAEARATVINANVDLMEKGLKSLRSEVQALEAVKSQLVHTDAAIARHNEDLRRELDRLNQSKMRLAGYDKLISDREAIEESFTSLQKARALFDALNRKALQLSKLNEKKNKYEKVIAQAQAELSKRHAIIASAIQQIEEKAGKLAEFRAEQQKLAPARQALDKLDVEIGTKRQLVMQQKSELSRLSARIAGFRVDIASIDEKLILLGKTEEDAKCPVCETELGAEKIELVQSRYADEKNHKLKQIKLSETGSAGLSAEIRSTDAEVAVLEHKLKKDSQSLSAREGQISQAIIQASEAASSLATEKARLSEIEETLAAHRYAQPEQEALARIDVEIAGLAFDENTLASLQADIERLKSCEEQKRMLDEALKYASQEQESAVGASKAICDINARLQTDAASREAIAQQLTSLPALSERLARAEAEFKQKSDEQKAVRERLAVLRERLAQLAEKQERITEKHRSIASAAENESLYRELARIFGKKGIQAMLIETALPEIEAEANRLLSRMTDGRMTLTFETQAPTKKGDISETLDIKIADELGTRNYEMFSGGEAFRIDFSVRIALSRLLARRAGAPLPTLIIDEGFGTQDADGIEKLKEAINSVQDDFQKILVITHIDELKDAFPTRIDVVKTADGSTIQVS